MAFYAASTHIHTELAMLGKSQKASEELRPPGQGSILMMRAVILPLLVPLLPCLRPGQSLYLP